MTKHVPPGMEEVVSLEDAIRSAYHGIAEQTPWPDSFLAWSEEPYEDPFQLAEDVEAVMKGKPTRISGTRLERLRVIKAKLDSAKRTFG